MKPITFNDLLERLKREDEVTLLEIFNLSSEELVDALVSLIEDKQDTIREYYGLNEESMDWQEESDES